MLRSQAKPHININSAYLLFVGYDRQLTFSQECHVTCLRSAAACVYVSMRSHCVPVITKPHIPVVSKWGGNLPFRSRKKNCVFKGFDSAKAASSRLEKLRLRIFMYPQMVSDWKWRGGERCLWFWNKPGASQSIIGLYNCSSEKISFKHSRTAGFHGTLACKCKYKQMEEKLTLDIFRNGVREALDAAGEVPGVLLDVETQPFATVHLGLHLL